MGIMTAVVLTEEDMVLMAAADIDSPKVRPQPREHSDTTNDSLAGRFGLLAAAGPETKPMKYTLDICGDKQIQNPTEADIQQALCCLDTRKNSAFLILGTSDLTYIQSCGDKNIGFDLEYQDGNTRNHYRATRDNFTAEEIIKAMTSYSTGADDWKNSIEWMHIDV